MSIFILDACTQVQLVTANVSLPIVKPRLQNGLIVWAIHSKSDISGSIGKILTAPRKFS
jgi:hypothetical protein